MTKRMLIDALHPEETRVAIADETQIFDFDFVSTAKKQLKGNIYLAKITRVEPSLQAAFVEYGGGKQGFLPFSEIHTDYYQIPVSDRKKLMEEAERESLNNDESPDTERQNTPIEASDNPGSAENTDETAAETNPGQEDAVNVAEERPAYLLQGAIDISISEDFSAAASEDAEKSEKPESSPETHEPAFFEPSEDRFGDNVPSSEENSGEENASAEGKEDAGEENKEEVETLTNGEDEAELRNKRKRNFFMRRYKIQEVIRRGQVVLIQVIKEERGNKGASLTTYLSLAGRYCVLMPNSPKDGGISRKIASAEDRKRLKAISTEFRLAEGMSVIIRTAGIDRTHAEIKRDFDYLVNLWNAIREDTLKSNAPALIYEESDIVKRAIRDQYSNDISEILVSGDEAYKSAQEFMKLLLPSHLPKVKQYNAHTPLFYEYDIEDQLLSMHDPVVKMKSGAYLVINPTEALISIDVNSGRATGERNIEETALKANLEAAAEIARQLRLRDLAGLVVIDFIDMLESRNRRAVEKMLKDSMKTDRAKIQLGRISPFGLLEMSRQRLRPSISETSMTQCPHCTGRGIIRSHESMSIQLIRAVEKEASSGNIYSLRVFAPQVIALHLLNHKRSSLRGLEKRYNISIHILINPDLAASEFTVEKIRRPQNERAERSENDFRKQKRHERGERNRSFEAQENEATETEEKVIATSSEETASDEGNLRRGRKRSRRNGRGNFADKNREDNVIDFPKAEEASESSAESESAEQPSNAEENNETGGKNRRERGGRRRNWRNKKERGENSENTQPQGNDEDIPTSWNGGAAASLSDGKALPAFASDTSPVAVPAPPTYKAFHDYKEQPAAVQSAEVLAETRAAPPKRGWWQRMISLDD